MERGGGLSSLYKWSDMFKHGTLSVHAVWLR
jgi:hypothetical protein